MTTVKRKSKQLGQILIELSAAMSEEVERLAGLDASTNEETEAVA